MFPEGLAEAVELEHAAPGTLEARVPPGQADAFRAAAEAGRHLLDTTRVAPTPARVEPPRILSVGQVLTYARCPRDFYWSVVRPLPTAPKPAARLGTVVHRLLERRARSLPDLLDSDDLDGDRPGGLAAPELIERATRNFAATRYADLPPPDAEVGVILRIGAWVVRGRIDAIFRLPEPGGLGGAGPAGPCRGRGPVVELVDWKTGGQVEETTGGLDQLAIYALALRELGQLPEDRCVVSYCYLGGDEPRIEHPGPRTSRPRPSASPGRGRPLRPRQGRLPARLWPPHLRDLPPWSRPPTPATLRHPSTMVGRVAGPARAVRGPRARSGRSRGRSGTRPSMSPGGDADLRERLRRALPVAMKARDRLAVAALRSALAAIDNAGAVDPPRPPPGIGGPAPAGSVAGHPELAGTVAGVGAAEVERRDLTQAQMEGIVRAEVADREAGRARLRTRRPARAGRAPAR